MPSKKPTKSHHKVVQVGHPPTPSPSIGKQKARGKVQTEAATAATEYDRTAARWTSLLRFTQGQSLGFEVRALLLVVLLSAVRMAESTAIAAVKFGNDAVQFGVDGMTGIFGWVAKLTSVSLSVLREIWQTSTEDDEGIKIQTPVDAERGSGSPNVNKELLRKLSPFHLKALMDYIDWCNDKFNFVTAAQCVAYMKNGVHPSQPIGAAQNGKKRRKKNTKEEKMCPALDDDLRCIVPRRSMLYCLRKHLGLRPKTQ